MDLTTLTYMLVVVVGLLSVDAIVHPPDAVLEAEAIGTFDKSMAINSGLVDDVLNQEARRITATPTVMTVPKIQVGRLEGLGMSVAQAMKMESVAYALQARFGYQPDVIKITLFGEGGTAKALVTGAGRQRMTSFQEQVVPEPGEPVVALLQRATLIGMAHIDPYLTALNVIQSHAEDKNFTNAETIIKYALASLPPTPINFERALFENLNGLIALFRNDAQSAHEWFERAEASCPDNTVADAITALNAAFAEMQIDHDRDAFDHIRRLMTTKRPTDNVLLSTAYLTAAAAQLALHDVNGADQTVAKAIETYPKGSSAYDLWAEIKHQKGDEAQAERLHRRALENSSQFENYGEIAALYFRMAWQNDQPVMRSPYSNPELGRVQPAVRAH